MSQTERANQTPAERPFQLAFLPTGLMALVTFILVVGTLIAGYVTTGPHLVREPTMSDLAAIETELSSAQNEVTVLQQRVEALSQTSSDVAVSSQLAQVRSDLDLLNGRLQVIEQAVLDNPAKALGLTLLSKDVKHLQQSCQSIEQDIGRIYDGIYVIMATFVAAVLAIVGWGWFTGRRAKGVKSG